MPCYTPFYVKNKFTEVTVPVPCGKCTECRNRRINGWAFRLKQELKTSTSAYFITLTYATDNIPFTKKQYTTLRKRDLQLFIKRLRKQHHNKHDARCIKYYVVGEYGGRTVRPHYHILLFNAQLKFISNAWGNGNVHYGEITDSSIRYSIDYMSKPKIIPQFEGDDRTPEFSLMSKGLGKNYLTNNMVKWHRKDLTNRMYCNLDDGKKIAMPRYYKEKIYKKQERSTIGKIMLKKLDLKNIDIMEKHPMAENNTTQAILRSFEKQKRKSKKFTL